MDRKTSGQIEQVLGYAFSDLGILRQALTHSSAVDNRLDSNERLEFLGDAILSAVICKLLFERFPRKLEGDLTKIKSVLVSRRTCARVFQQLGLHAQMKVGKGMDESQSLTGSVAACGLEAVIAAIYLDGGLVPARDFITRQFGHLIEKAHAYQAKSNFKSLLQQHAQQEFNTVPKYEVLDEKGPDHKKCFEAEVVIGDRHFRSAWGTNKKEAEQRAALNALSTLGVLDETFEELEV